MTVRYHLALCLIFRDEASYLVEWLRFHTRVGVEHFFLYDNESSDEPVRILRDLLPADRWTLVPWPGRGVQRSAYQHCLENFGPLCRWLGFIDVDEFLFSPEGRDLRTELEARACAPAVAIDGLLFGTSGHVERPDALVTKAYTWRARENTVHRFSSRLRRPDADPNDDASYFPMSAHVKCVVQPARTVACEGPHRFRYAGGQLAVSETGVPTDGNYTAEVSVQALRLHHYWTRSVSEFSQKLARAPVSGRAPYDASTGFAVAAKLHEVCDRTLTCALDRDSGFPARATDAPCWVPLRAEYRGEEVGACAQYPGQSVRYLLPDEADAFAVTVHEGLLRTRDGSLVTTASDDRGKAALCVLSVDGRLYVATGKRGHVHHSSLVAGGPVAFAGRLIVTDGRIESLDSECGHYRVPPSLGLQFLRWLEVRGVDRASVAVRWR